MNLSSTAIVGMDLAKQPDIPSPGSSITEWSVLGAVAFYIGKEMLQFFKDKDKSEGELTASLIQDLRSEAKSSRELQATTLGSIVSLQTKTSATLEAVKDTLEQLGQSDQQHKRDAAMLILEIRGVRDEMVLVREQMKALHDRLDRQQFSRGT